MARGDAEERQSGRVLVRRLRAVSHVLHLRKGDLPRHISERYTVAACVVMAYIVMAYIVMAHIAMAYVVTVNVVPAYLDTAYIVMPI